jgi:hypothetical protein
MEFITCASRKRPVTGRLFVLPLAQAEVSPMEKKYWIGRKHASMRMAHGAASAEARLVHYELAGRYSIKAAQCLAAGRPAAEDARAMLHLPDPASIGAVLAGPRRDAELEASGGATFRRSDPA